MPTIDPLTVLRQRGIIGPFNALRAHMELNDLLRGDYYVIAKLTEHSTAGRHVPDKLLS